MKFTTGQIWTVMNPQSDNQSIISNLYNQKIDIVTACKLKILVSLLLPIYQSAEECRIKLIIELGVKKEDGTISINDSSPENKIKFNEEYKSLMSQENEIKMDKIIINTSKANNKDLFIEANKIELIEPFIEIK